MGMGFSITGKRSAQAPGVAFDGGKEIRDPIVYAVDVQPVTQAPLTYDAPVWFAIGHGERFTVWYPRLREWIKDAGSPADLSIDDNSFEEFWNRINRIDLTEDARGRYIRVDQTRLRPMSTTPLTPTPDVEAARPIEFEDVHD